MSEQTLQDDSKVELEKEPVVQEESDLTSLVEEQAQTIKELAELVNELRNKQPSAEVEGYIIYTPDRFEKDGSPIPGYNGSTSGINFRNGIGYLTAGQLERIPPIPEKPEHRMEPDAKIAWICKDFGYKYEKGSASKAMELMGGLDAVHTVPEILVG